MKNTISNFWSASLFIPLILLSACSQRSKEQAEENTHLIPNSGEDILVDTNQNRPLASEPKLLNEDEDTIKYPCAILISPGEKRIEELGESYHILGGMNSANLRLVELYLDSIGVRKLFESSEGTINLISKENKIFSLDPSQFDWGFILFDGHEAPRKMDMDEMLKNDSSFYKIYYYNMTVVDSLR